jgi:flagellar biosynthesis protein FlhB
MRVHFLFENMALFFLSVYEEVKKSKHSTSTQSRKHLLVIFTEIQSANIPFSFVGVLHVLSPSIMRVKPTIVCKKSLISISTFSVLHKKSRFRILII